MHEPVRGRRADSAGRPADTAGRPAGTAGRPAGTAGRPAGATAAGIGAGGTVLGPARTALGTAGTAPGIVGPALETAAALYDLCLPGGQAGSHGGTGLRLLGRRHASVLGASRGSGGRRILDGILSRSDRRSRDPTPPGGRA